MVKNKKNRGFVFKNYWSIKKENKDGI